MLLAVAMLKHKSVVGCDGQATLIPCELDNFLVPFIPAINVTITMNNAVPNLLKFLQLSPFREIANRDTNDL